MKKFLIVLLSVVLYSNAFSIEYRPDPVLTESQKKEILDALPKKAFVKPQTLRKVLVFSRTTSFRHYEGIVTAAFVIENMGNDTQAWQTLISADLANFEKDNIKNFDLIVLSNSTGNPFGESPEDLKKLSDDERNKALEREKILRDNLMKFVADGGAVLGIHGATDAYRGKDNRFEPFLEMLGGDFVGHPWTTKDTPSFIVVEDTNSPITKGIWQENNFRVQTELYMMGTVFKRANCRVLLALDPDKSASGKKFRDDKDIALVWIKNYGKGRVAYTAFGHSGKIYLDEKYNELLLRLIQFATGDLPTDTSSLSKPDFVQINNPYAKPTLEELRALSKAEYGTNSAELDMALFATYANAKDSEFAESVRSFIYSEILAQSGTQRYRDFLAQLLIGVGIGNEEYLSKFKEILKSEKSAATADRINIAIGKFENFAQYTKVAEAYKAPSSLPQNDKEIFRLLSYLIKNPDVAIPSYLAYNTLSENNKAALIYAYAARKTGMDILRKFEIDTPYQIKAYAYAASVMGGSQDFEKILSKVQILSPLDSLEVQALMLNIPCENKIDVLAELLMKSKDAERAFLTQLFSRYEISSKIKELFDKFDSSNTEQKVAILKLLESCIDESMFGKLAEKLPAQKEKSVKTAIYKNLVYISRINFTENMLSDVAKVYQESADIADKQFVLRFTPLLSNQKSLELCQRAISDSLTDEAVKYLSEWRNTLAYKPLLEIVKKSQDKKSVEGAKWGIANLSQKLEITPEAMDYLLSTSKESEKSKLYESALSKPTQELVEYFKNKNADISKKIEEQLAKKTLTFSSNNKNSEKFFARAVDKDMNTRWISSSSIRKDMFIELDFGIPTKVEKIVLNTVPRPAQAANKVKVLVGSDMKNLKPADFTYDVGIDGLPTIKFAYPIFAKLVRIQADKDESYGWSIYEVVIE